MRSLLFIVLLCIFIPLIYNQVITTAKSRIGVLEPPECGLSNASLHRIIGGEPAKLGAWPWMSVLGYTTTDPTQTYWACGGSLISAYHVLTAAHCVFPELYKVRIGDLDLENDNDGATPFEDDIKQKEVHPQYDSTTHVNDVAILRTFKRVPFTSLRHPICLPFDLKTRYRDINNLYGIVAGWGRTTYNGMLNKQLLEVQIPIITEVECKRIFPVGEIDQRTVCGGAVELSACPGDSGSPLMIPSIDNPLLYYIYGVVSLVNCKKLIVFTRVTSFVNYIILNSLY